MQVSNLSHTIPQLPAQNLKSHKAEGMSTFTKVLIVALAILMPAIAVACLGFAPAIFNAVGLAGLAGLSFGAGMLGLGLSILGITQCGKPASPTEEPATIQVPRAIASKFTPPQPVVSNATSIPQPQSPVAKPQSAQPVANNGANIPLPQSLVLQTQPMPTIVSLPPNQPVVPAQAKPTIPAAPIAKLPSEQLKAQGFDIVEAHAEFPKVTKNKKCIVRDRTMQTVIDELNTSFNIISPPIRPLVTSREILNDYKAMAAKVGKDVETCGYQIPPQHLPKSIQDVGNRIKYFKNAYQTRTAKTNLFARYDVFAIPCKMDYDSNWERFTGNQVSEPFYVHQASGINIGGRKDAEDFADFTNGLTGKLHEDAYLHAMFELFTNILEAQKTTDAQHIVWYPFGMGDFLQHLNLNDPSYDQQKLNLLKDRIAEKFIEALNQCYVQYPIPDIHLCLPTGNKESDPNYLAFYKALGKASAQVKPQIRLHLNADSADVAQKLANQHGAYKVSLVNRTSRNQFGNGWFLDMNYSAIDENLHRRSSLLANISLWLNGGLTKTQPAHDELEIRLLALNATSFATK